MIDLNCDLGEGFPNDAELMPLISSANIACGYHAGDARAMRRCVELALQHGVAIGAHPGFADRENFGRLEIRLAPGAYARLVREQLEIFGAIIQAAGGALHHVKPHGALYNLAARDAAVAREIAAAVLAFDPNLLLYGLSGSQSLEQARQLGLRTASEAFADRGYQPDGSLTPRSQAGALIVSEEKCRKQALELVLEKNVTAVDGTRVPLSVDTICLHGDGAHAVAFARSLRRFLDDHSIPVQAP